MLLGRYAGTMAIALAVLAWTARGAAASPERNTLVLGITVASALSAVVCLNGALNAGLNGAAWIPTVGCAAFTVLFLTVGRGKSAAPAGAPAA